MDYDIEMPHRRKKRHIFHVNLLKKWELPSDLSCVASEEEEDEFPEWSGSEESPPRNYGEQLTDIQRKELDQLLEESDGVARGKTGQTHVAELDQL